MELIVCKDQGEVAARATEWCRHQCDSLGIRSLFVPAGATPEPLYAHWQNERPTFIETLRLMQIDDVLTGPKSGEFRRFLRTKLAPFVEKIEFIELADSAADSAILGLGLNGHVAFHEPGIPSDFYSGCVRLSAATCERLGLELGTWGITYGLGAFLKCQSLLLIVTGAAKREVFARFLAADTCLPAVQLKSHPGLTVICDQVAAGGQ